MTRYWCSRATIPIRINLDRYRTPLSGMPCVRQVLRPGPASRHGWSHSGSQADSRGPSAGQLLSPLAPRTVEHDTIAAGGLGLIEGRVRVREQLPESVA